MCTLGRKKSTLDGLNSSPIGKYILGAQHLAWAITAGKTEPGYSTGKTEPGYITGKTEPGYSIGKTEPGYSTDLI